MPPREEDTGQDKCLENKDLLTPPQTIKTGTTTTLTGSITPGNAWIRGNTYSPNSAAASRATGQLIKAPRPPALVNSTTSAYPAIPPPTYANYPLSSIVNVKSVASHPVSGDGVADDTASLQAILNEAAADGKVVYFPHGIYLLTDTLVIPPNSRLVGEAWSQLSASGAKFADAKKPRAMIQVGANGSKGVAQMSDFIFTVADILPGTVLVEVNMSGDQAGDVGFWNCHFVIGGNKGSKVRGTTCAKAENCLAARLSLHLTEGSSSYWENVWSWVADHDLDESAGGNVYPGAAGGFLVEAKGGTWILGMGVGKLGGCENLRTVRKLTDIQSTMPCTRSTSTRPRTCLSDCRRERRHTGKEKGIPCWPRRPGRTTCWRVTRTSAGAGLAMLW